jgi:hypothetical protein
VVIVWLVTVPLVVAYLAFLLLCMNQGQDVRESKSIDQRVDAAEQAVEEIGRAARIEMWRIVMDSWGRWPR